MMVEGGATVTGDSQVLDLSDRVNDSAEIGWLGRRQWLVKSASFIQ